MSDNEISWRILEVLKEAFDEEPDTVFLRRSLLKKIGCSDTDLIKSIHDLEKRALVSVEWLAAGEFLLKINVYGIDEIENAMGGNETDNKIRESIIEILADLYNKDPLGSMREIGLYEKIKFSEKEITRNVAYLGNKGRIKVDWFAGGNYLVSPIP